jgi:hypothetical protein
VLEDLVGVKVFVDIFVNIPRQEKRGIIDIRRDVNDGFDVSHVSASGEAVIKSV